MKRKILYLIIGCLTLGLGISITSKWFLPVHPARTFKVVSEDGAGSGSMKIWESSDGAKVYVSVVRYSSVEDAVDICRAPAR